MKVNTILQCVNFIKYYIQNAKSVILTLLENIEKPNNYTLIKKSLQKKHEKNDRIEQKAYIKICTTLD
jgi:hypothetical protein